MHHIAEHCVHVLIFTSLHLQLDIMHDLTPKCECSWKHFQERKLHMQHMRTMARQAIVVSSLLYWLCNCQQPQHSSATSKMSPVSSIDMNGQAMPDYKHMHLAKLQHLLSPFLMLKHINIPKPSNQWLNLVSPTSYIAGALRKNLPHSHSGRVPKLT